MATKAEGLYAALQPRRVALPGGGKAIAVKVGPEKSRQIYRHEIHVPVPVSVILDVKSCNNLVHFEIIFIVKRSAKMVKLG
jgi:hypothetical protein